jgi:hypothetical protein
MAKYRMAPADGRFLGAYDADDAAGALGWEDWREAVGGLPIVMDVVS